MSISSDSTWRLENLPSKSDPAAISWLRDQFSLSTNSSLAPLLPNFFNAANGHFGISFKGLLLLQHNIPNSITTKREKKK